MMLGRPEVDPVELSSRSIRAVTLFVADLERSKRWYAEGLGLSKVFEDEHSAVFRFANTIVNLLVAAEAGELIAPAAVGLEGSGARCLLTIGVDDVPATCAALAQRGVALPNGPVDRPWGVRTAALTDPDGHLWELAQELP